MRSFSILVILVAAMAFSDDSVAAECPCDIYSAGGTPCVAAYSTVRQLSSTYTGPLYQVRRTSDKQTKDINTVAGTGFASAAAQDSFLGTGAGTISKLYDQSGKGNDITVAKKGCYIGDAAKDDNESNAKGRSLMVNGHKVYGLYMISRDGYRSNQEGYTGYPVVAKAANGMPTGSQPQGIYMVVDPKRGGGGCCWDFGNASTNNCNGGTGMMNALYIGKDWGQGAGTGPWFAVDFEAGVWAGGTKKGDPGWGAWNEPHTVNPNDPSLTMDYAFGIAKTNATNYAIRAADAQKGNLTTAYDGLLPETLHWGMQGSVVLGIGGDNSIFGSETFFEGVITNGRPTDRTDTLVLKNVQAAGYGITTVSTKFDQQKVASGISTIKVQCISGTKKAVIGFTLQSTSRVHMNIFDQQGRLISNVGSSVFSAGSHNIVWNAAGTPAGVYVARVEINDRDEWSGKIIIGK